MGVPAAGEYRRAVPEETPEPCWMCGATEHVFRFECPECMRRWEETECRELRERLFPRTEPSPVAE
jgi:hypothetical protein